MVDRAYNGFVVDFLDFIGIFIIIRYSMWQICDLYGAGLLALDAFKGDKKERSKNEDNFS